MKDMSTGTKVFIVVVAIAFGIWAFYYYQGKKCLLPSASVECGKN